MWEYNYSDELYHHGVKGMKWGVRRYRNADGTLTARGKARQEYKDAKKEYKIASRDYAYTGGYGIEGIKRAQAAQKKMNDAEMRALEAKAKYKASKAKTAEKADEAEMKTYFKEMKKTGLAGSTSDTRSGGRSTRIYNQMLASKGKEYADKVHKKVEGRAYTQLVATGAVVVGSAIVSAYLAAIDN